jgi:hypothetical protein
LRLYAAWSTGASNIIETRAEDWFRDALSHASAETDAKTPAAA